MHTQAAPLPSYHIPGGFEQLYQRSSSLTIYSDTDDLDPECRQSDNYLDTTFPDCIYGKLYKSRCLSGSLSSSQSDDSLEGRNQSLEDYHFQKALNQGVFNSASAYNKRERKRSFRRVRKKSHSESSCDSFDESKIPLEQRHELLFCSNALSGSSNLKDFDSGYRQNSGRVRRKESLPKRGERFRKELSNCGIDLHDANDKMDIEQIYQLQQRFFTGLKIRGDSELENERQDCVSVNNSPPQGWIKKKRCASSIN